MTAQIEAIPGCTARCEDYWRELQMLMDAAAAAGRPNTWDELRRADDRFLQWVKRRMEEL